MPERACNYFESGSIRIRTYDENGIILHAGWQENHLLSYHEYIILEIVQGSLRAAAYSLNRGKYSPIHRITIDISNISDPVAFNISNADITDGEWHDIEWTHRRDLTSLNHVLSVVVDGSVTSSASMSGDINQLAINGTAYFHIGGLTDFDNIQIQRNITGTSYCM